MGGLPLTGVKVIELGANLAGPYAAQILSHLGAEVVKVERASGDDARHWGETVTEGAGASFHAVNMNKQSILLDLKDQARVAWLKEFIGTRDVLVQNMRPGTLEEIGLGPADMTARHPRLIYCSVGAFGPVGPLRRNPGYEPMVQAFSGLMMLQANAPSRIGTQVLDHGTGMWAAMGCLAGLLQRARTGKGCIIDAALFDTALGWLTIPGAQLQCLGSLPERHPTGSARLIPFQGFDTKNGPVVVAAGNDRLFAKVAAALGKPEWAKDPTLVKNEGRLERKDWLIGEMQKILLTKTKGEWVDIFSAIDVPCAPINTVQEALAHPQAEASGMLQEVPGLGIKLMTLPLRFDGERPKVRAMAPKLGAHTAAVMGAEAAE